MHDNVAVGSDDRDIEVLDIINSIIQQDGLSDRADELEMGTSFEEFGLASADIINVVIAVEVAMDIEFEEEDLTEENFRSASTINTLLRLDKYAA